MKSRFTGCVWLLVLAVSVTLGVTVPAIGQSFGQTCPIPSFPGSAATPIDGSCGPSGSGGPEASQNTAKNDFCAGGDPMSVTIDQLAGFQSTVESKNINFGDENTATRKKGPTTDRAPLESIGEGKLVILRGFVLKARQEGGESVNCGKAVPNQPLFHDIHISIVADSTTTDECSGVVVEMSPHHRPSSWNINNMQKVAGSGIPVRVTGHLFFDSSHVPCANGQGVRSNPKRISLWEVHPIYQLELCTGNCSGTGNWVSLDEWVKSQ